MNGTKWEDLISAQTCPSGRFDLADLFEHNQEPSLGDGHIPPIKYTWKLEDKIVPEHIELMQTFLKKVVTDKLIALK